MQYRRPVGFGPSLKTWPTWESQRRHITSVRTEKKLRSSSVFTAFGAIGCQKLGQPGPESNFVSELKSGRSQHTPVEVPLAWLSQFGPWKARSVPFFRVTRYCAGVRSFFHSASVLTTRSPAPARRGRVRARKSRRLMEVMYTLGNAFRGRIIPSGLPGSLPEVLEGHADAIGVGPKTQDAHADREVLAEKRARQEHPLPGVHAVHEVPVQAIHFRARRARRREAEREERQLRLGHNRHAGDRAHGLGRLPREIELLVERRAEGREAAELQREPDPDAAEVS